MKKITAFAATILCVFALFFGAAATVKADGQGQEQSQVNTEIFLPTTYLQYYKLENPYAICRRLYNGKELVAISHKGAIVVYYDEKFYKRDITELSSEQGVPSLQLYGEYLLFSAQSKLFSIFVGDLDSGEELSYKSVKCDDETVSANDFSVCGDKVAVITSNTLDFYGIISDQSGIALVKENGLNMNGLNSVLLSKNGLTYFYDKDNSGIYVYDGEIAEKLVSAAEVRAIAESGDIGDKVLYYSCSGGVYSVDLTDGQKESVPVKEVSPQSEPDKDLGKIWKPQGICLTGKGLWVVDGEICAVQEIDLSTGEFTDFAITTNSRAVNRLSLNAKDVTVDGGNLYALDENRIVVVENAYADKDARAYRRINLDVFPDKFSVGGGYVTYSVGKKVYLGKIPSYEEGQAEITLEKIPLINGETDSDVAVDICYKDGAFYVLSNVLDNQKTYPVIYKIDLSADGKTLGKFYDKKVTEEKANRIAVDVFGSVYMSVTDPSGAKYSFYSVTPEKATKLLTDYSPSGDVIKMQTDFDGKLYLLGENGAVTCLDSGGNGYEERFVKTVKKSPNLDNGGVGDPVSFALDENSDKAYFIFGGLILSSSEKTELNIATVNTIPVPSDFSYAFNISGSFGKLRENSKLFSIKSTEISGEYFIYENYFTQTQSDDYAFLSISDRFSLAVKRGVTAIVRNSDIIGQFTADRVSGEYYALVAFKTYSLPVLEDTYYTELAVGSKQKISVGGEVEFNGVRFAAVCKDGVYGYIPYTFLTERISAPQSEKTIKTAYVYARGGVEVYDEEYNLTGKIVIEKERVDVIGEGKDYTYVRFADGTCGYVKTAYLTTNSRENFIKCLVVILCASSFLVTSLFFERKYLFETR